MASKFHSRKTRVNGQLFDSRKEARRFVELSLLLKSGAITDLRTQVPFELIPAQYSTVDTGRVYKRGEHKGEPILKRICIEKALKYVADFTYYKDGELVVEDAKGVRTKDYVIKRKLALYLKGIRIKEV